MIGRAWESSPPVLLSSPGQQKQAPLIGQRKTASLCLETMCEALKAGPRILFEICPLTCTPSPCCLQVDCQGQVSAELNEDTQSPLQEDRAHTPRRPGPGERLLAGAMCARVAVTLQRLMRADCRPDKKDSTDVARSLVPRDSVHWLECQS